MAKPISTSYTDKQKAAIIEHVLAELSGGRAVSRVLREDPDMCPKSTFWNWCFNDEDLMGKVARAREHGVESVLDDALDISDQQQVGETITTEGDKTTIRREDMLGHRKLRIETRVKYAQMIAPRKYGPKLDLTSGGERVQMDETAVAVRAAAILKMGLDRAGSD